MEDLIIYLLILALAYYLLIHLPKQRKLAEPTKPFTTNRSIQTDPNFAISTDEQDLEQTLDQLITNIRKLNSKIK